MYTTRVRVAMIPISFELKDKAVVNELLIDYTNDTVHIKTDTEVLEYPSKELVNEYLKNELIKNNIYRDDVDFVLLLNESEEQNEKVNKYKNTDGENIGTDDIIKSMRGIDTTDTLMDLIYYKVNKVKGKAPVSNNYTNYYRDKLISTDKYANDYTHPEEQQCNYEPPVRSVNNKTGIISIHKSDIKGLENVEKDANNYIHPIEKQCVTQFKIKTINGMSDREITLTKKDLGLDNVTNMPLLTSEQIHDGNATGYVTPKAITDYIDALLGGI